MVQTGSGDDFQVTHEGGLTVLAAAKDFSLTGQLKLVRAMGGGNLLVDLVRCGAFSERGKAVLAAVRTDQEMPGTVLFNFVRGLSGGRAVRVVRRAEWLMLLAS